MFILPRFLLNTLPAAVFVLSLAAGLRDAGAQTTIQGSYPIGLEHAETEPYNFTGRVFDLNNVAFGSGTLIRRHTVLTAGHVVYDPSTGFISSATFTRGLYEDYSYDKNQVINVAVLGGYQAAVASSGTNASIAAFDRDMGYVLLMAAPRDGSWGVYLPDPTQLEDSANQFFVLGYPGVTFDGRTMAYIVPSSTFTQIGSSATTGLYENDGYSAEPGESGGPVYIFNGVSQLIVGETVGGVTDTSGEFNASLIRGITTDANQFLTAAEYTNGLIAKVKIKGPRTVTHGTTVTFTAEPRFLIPDVGTTSGVATTNRYQEIRLVTSTPGTSTTPEVTVKKLSNTQFQVSFSSKIRPNSTTMLTAYYSKTDMVPNSTITINVK